MFFLQSCALTTFPGFSTSRFYNVKLKASKIFWGAPPMSSPTGIWLYQGYRRQSPWPGGWETCSSGSLRPYLSQMPCVLRVPPACAAGGHARWLQARSRTGVALRRGSWKLWSEMRDVPSRRESQAAHCSLKAHIFHLPINTFFNCFIHMESKEGAESPGKTGQGSGCVQG